MPERNVLELLEKSSKKYANKIAVKELESMCTFYDLCIDSKKIGSALLKYNIFGKVIPVFAEKSINTLKAFFGIVYAGGCYTLMSPTQTADRILKIESITEAEIIITTSENTEKLKGTGVKAQILLIEDLLKAEIDDELLLNIRNKAIDTDPLYVNFTSGSTGVPKGVVVGHQSVIEFINYFTELFDITDEDIIGNQAPFDFDVSVKDIYSMLMTGATMVIIPKNYFAFPKKILDVLTDEKITVLTWAVSALCMITSLKAFSYKHPKDIKKVIFSGEVMPMSHLREWKKELPEAMFVNVYGPTEITCNCTYFIVTDESLKENSIPIGKAFPNERVLLLDDNGNEVIKPGEEGEICVAGSTLALGYYADEERTRQSFTQNPCNKRYNQLIYHTGDVAYYREDGNLMYVGRKDFQIKHLGHRIELGEIETYINELDEIVRSCCIYDLTNEKIVAFYQGDISGLDIKKRLRNKLIKYMIPEQFIQVEKMPITGNGKIDRKKLKKDYLEVQDDK